MNRIATKINFDSTSVRIERCVKNATRYFKYCTLHMNSNESPDTVLSDINELERTIETFVTEIYETIDSYIKEDVIKEDYIKPTNFFEKNDDSVKFDKGIFDLALSKNKDNIDVINDDIPFSRD